MQHFAYLCINIYLCVRFASCAAALRLVRDVLLVFLEFGLKGEGVHAHLLYHGEQAI